MKIRDVARAVGLNPRTIRYYERRGLLKPSRTGSRYRVFGEADLIRLKLVTQLRRLGFSILETKQVLPILVNSLPLRQRTQKLKTLLEKRLRAAAENLQELAEAHQELEARFKKLSSKRRSTKASCCEPFCGPQTCGSGLAQITELGQGKTQGGRK